MMIVVVEMLNLNMQSVKSYSWENKHKVLLRSTFLIRLCLILFNEKKRTNERVNKKRIRCLAGVKRCHKRISRITITFKSYPMRVHN